MRALSSRGRAAVCFLSVIVLSAWPAGGADLSAEAKRLLEKIGPGGGVCALVGSPDAAAVIRLAQAGKMLVYVQSADAKALAAIRKAADEAGLLGRRIFVSESNSKRIHLADNLADAVVVTGADSGVARADVLRVLHPGAKGALGEQTFVKGFPKGTDGWSHPHHGPDNNTQSADRLARAPYLTQFIAGPKFSPMPQVTVAAGGRVFRAFGHLAHRTNQNAVLNTLLAINGYNGTILWRRALKNGFMIHRNAFIATPQTLYLADDESCKLLDPATGKVRDQIVIPEGLSDGPVWKWMALAGADRLGAGKSVLYALVGGQEVKVPARRSRAAGLGHWGWGMWTGHAYKDPKTNFGYGRTIVAIDPATKKVLWSHREQEYLDSRGVCMGGGKIYFYSDRKFLGCLDAERGKVLWKATDPELLKAIGPHGRAQTYTHGYATQTYIKCNDKYVFFAGPHRRNLVAVRAKDGALAWQKPDGNYLLVLRAEGLYAIGRQGGRSYRLDYDTGRVQKRFLGRRACTRATGSVDSILFRAGGGTVRLDVATGEARHIAPFRPPCQDGVIISHGYLYWGPWMCGCALSLYGHVCLGPAGNFDFRPGIDEGRLQTGPADPAAVEARKDDPNDWPCYRGDNRRTGLTQVTIPKQVKKLWVFRPASPGPATAPVMADGSVFVGHRSGAVYAINAADGRRRWTAHTGGPVFFPPAIWNGRVYVGSGDGWVYAFEAATGRQLWRFRVAPAERRIHVFGQLLSTWPVAGGVVVKDGVVYAAAGIAHYDGTHVVALDAVTGKVKWYNDTSGVLDPKIKNGVSLQGNLHLARGKLCFQGGNAVNLAYFDLKTGKCLNSPSRRVGGVTATAFSAYYPEYGSYARLKHDYPDGRTLSYTVMYEGSRRSGPAMLAAGTAAAPSSGQRWSRRSGRKAIWGGANRWDCHAFIVGQDVLVAAGLIGLKGKASFGVAAMDLKDGSQIWTHPLPGRPVKWGAAVDRAGRVAVSLINGRVLCFAKTP